MAIPRALPGARGRKNMHSAIQKTEYFRSPKYLRASRGQPCTLQVPGVCCGDWETTCAAHSNSSAYGKGKSIKAQDWAVADACYTCHRWLDQGPAPRATKERVWFKGWVLTLASRLRRGVIKTALDLSNPDPATIAEAFRCGDITI
jgi:hypothetical protein